MAYLSVSAARPMTALRCLALLTLAVSAAGCRASGPVGNAPPDYAAGDTLLPHDAFVLASRVLGEPRPVNVYLPPGYATSDRRFPVLFMPDGGTTEDFPHVTATVDSMIAEGAMLPVVVVGIANTVRRRDLTPPTSVASDREVAPVVGGAPAFRAFLRDELMPEIARRYRTDGVTAIMGESLAGLFVVDTLFEQPGLFRTYIALDPSLWWDGGARVRAAPDWLAAHRTVSNALYLASSDEPGIAQPVATLAAALQADAPPGLRWTSRPRPDLSHATIYRATKRDALAWAFPRPTGPR